MKTINAIVKVLTALATIAGAVYIIATYGDKIVEWAKQLLAKAPQAPAPVVQEAPVDTAPAEAASVSEEATCDTPASADEVPAENAEPVETAEAPAEVDTNAPVADESDFEG